jgi:hypothetical protein
VSDKRGLISGMLSQTLQLFKNTDLDVCGEIQPVVPIKQPFYNTICAFTFLACGGGEWQVVWQWKRSKQTINNQSTRWHQERWTVV